MGWFNRRPKGTPKLSEEMIRCVYRADLKGAEKLLKSGHPVDAVDTDGRPALIHAILATPPNIDLVSLLIRSGADVNLNEPAQHWAPLAVAARDCSPEICQLLLDAGAEIDAVDIFGNTALWRAIMAGKIDNLALLVSRGANLDLANNSSVSPRALAEQIGTVLPEGTC